MAAGALQTPELRECMPSWRRACLLLVVGGMFLISLDVVSRYAPRAHFLFCCVPCGLFLIIASLSWALDANDDATPVVGTLWRASAYSFASVLLLLQWAAASRALGQRMSGNRAVLSGFLLALACWLLIVCGIFRFAKWTWGTRN